MAASGVRHGLTGQVHNKMLEVRTDLLTSFEAVCL